MNIASIASRGEVVPAALGQAEPLAVASFVELGKREMSQSAAARWVLPVTRREMWRLAVQVRTMTLTRGGRLPARRS